MWTSSGLPTSPCSSRGANATIPLMKRLWVASLVLLTATAQQFSPGVKNFTKVQDQRIVLQHIRVIDGTGAPARDDQTLVITNGRILSIGSTVEESPLHTTKLDLAGYTAIPGLVGMHEHLYYTVGQGGIVGEMPLSFPRLYLAAGVTSIRTTGSVEPYTDIEIKKQIDSGQAVGPKMRLTAPYLEGAGTSDVQLHQLKDAAEARAMVDYWADAGMTSYKAYTHITRDELQAAADQAHKHGLKITGHLCSIGFSEAAALGIDNLEHGLLVDTEFYSHKKPDICDFDGLPALLELATLDTSDPHIQEMIKTLVAHHVAVTSTMPVFEHFVPGRPPIDRRALDAMAPDARSSYLLRRAAMSDPTSVSMFFGPAGSIWPKLLHLEMQFERDFVRAGGLLLAGVDPTGIGGALAGFGDQRELELLVEAGFTPLEAIHIATANGAQFLADDSIGILAPGKAADLVVIKGNPASNIRDIEKTEIVFKDGVGYDSQKLIDAVRGRVGLD